MEWSGVLTLFHLIHFLCEIEGRYWIASHFIVVLFFILHRISYTLYRLLRFARRSDWLSACNTFFPLPLILINTVIFPQSPDDRRKNAFDDSTINTLSYIQFSHPVTNNCFQVLFCTSFWHDASIIHYISMYM